MYSKISLGWHSNASQIASSVEKRIAFAFPVFKIDKLAKVIPIIWLIHYFSFFAWQVLRQDLQL